MSRRLHVCARPGCAEFWPCPQHTRPRNARWSQNRDGAAQGRFRNALKRRSGGLCERCGDLGAVAHHVRPGYSPDDGLFLCDDCHAALDHNARRA